MAAAAAAAREARAVATSARAKLAAAVPSERHAANGRLGKAAQMSGSVKHVTPTSDDVAARAEAEAALAVEQMALREMRDRGHGWVCALYVRGKLHVYLAGDLGGHGLRFGHGRPWVKEIVACGLIGQVPVDEARLESQRMVVMDKQRFFFFDTDGVEPFRDVRDVAACR